MPAHAVRRLVGSWCIAGVVWFLTVGCGTRQPSVPPSIEFTRLPPAGEGNSDLTYPIQGRVKGERKGQKVVLFAHAGVWWVQPLVAHPFTAIDRDSTWTGSTHPGIAYAALLVDADYRPPSTLDQLPPPGGSIRAVVQSDGAKLEQSKIKQLDFSGYEWIVQQNPANPAGMHNRYDAANAWVDENGLLHLRIQKEADGWTSAEVGLYRSLGYGSYRFVVRDISQLDPPVVLSIASWDGTGPNREMDIEISRWGESAGKNAQYVVQPYYIAANVVRFLAPPGRLSYSFDWEPGRADFRTVRGWGNEPGTDVVASHVFTSGVPTPGAETLHLNLYVFGDQRVRFERSVEVIVEKFQYLP